MFNNENYATMISGVICTSQLQFRNAFYILLGNVVWFIFSFFSTNLQLLKEKNLCSSIKS